jgi:hypothetical protein
MIYTALSTVKPKKWPRMERRARIDVVLSVNIRAIRGVFLAQAMLESVAAVVEALLAPKAANDCCTALYAC